MKCSAAGRKHFKSKEYYFFAEHVSVGYDRPLIKQIKISLQKGEILCLIGPNGAGKSTVLKSIAGQLRLLEGSVYLGEEILSGMKQEERAKRLSVMLTEKMKTELMTCADVVATGRYPYTGRFGVLSEKDYRMVDEVMELVRVTELRDQDFRKISDGQRQRVMLARAICQEPEIMILDEPTSYLDVKYKLEFLSVLQEMKEKRGLTVIMSLHELELAKRVSDKLLCLKGEYVEKYGTPEDIFQPGYIRQLFDITGGCFDEESGSLELEPSKGKPELFVIGGGKSAGNLYHRLQRQRTPFATGIIFDNDLDYPAAKALASQLFSAKAFEPVGEQVLIQAKHAIDACSQVVCCREHLGSLEIANRELLAYAQRLGKLKQKR